MCFSNLARFSQIKDGEVMNRHTLRTALVVVLIGSMVAFATPLSISHAAPSVTILGEVAFGRDLCIPVSGTKPLLLLCGDTTSENVVSGGPKSTDRENTGLRFNGTSASPINGDAQLWPGGVPTGAIKVGSKIIAFYSEGHHYGHNFDIFASGVVVSSDNARTWTKHPLRGPNNIFSQATPYPQVLGGYVYVFGTLGGRQGPAYLSRVAAGRLTDLTAYQYWTGGGWNGNMAAAVPVINDSVGELSISRYGGGYIALYMSPAGSGLVYATAPALTGPWGNITTFANWGPSGPQYSIWYGTYAPQILSVSGKTIRFLFSRWDDYRVRLAQLVLG